MAAMNQTKFRDYIKLRNLTNGQAAAEIGISRPLVQHALKGNPLGRKSAIKVEKWSNGFLSAVELAGFRS